MSKKQPELRVVTTEDALAGFEPKLLSTVETLDMYWPFVAPLLERVVAEAMHGEMTLGDIYDGIKAGQMVCVVATRDGADGPEVPLALVLQPLMYPRLDAMEIVAIGGQQLNLLQSAFWSHVCSWAFMNGARTMQAQVSPAMARVISKYGFEAKYTLMRMDLTEI